MSWDQIRNLTEMLGIDSETSDAGSQYRCGRVGRGIQAPSTPQPTSNTQTYTKSIENGRFFHQSSRMDRWTDGPTDRRINGPTDQRTDKASYRIACPQLKRNCSFCFEQQKRRLRCKRQFLHSNC